MIGYPEKIQSEEWQLMTNHLTHELKSLLATIKSGLHGIQTYFPALLTAYNEAIHHQLDVPIIPVRPLSMLSKTLQFSERAAYCANLYVSMFSMNISKINREKLCLAHCSILECIQRAVHFYPYRSEEETAYLLRAAQINQDFLFEGDKIFFINLLMNLFRYCIYHIQDAEKGQIISWTEVKDSSHYLFIRTTSGGCSLAQQEAMFAPLHSSYPHDLGMGLFFCKQLMQALKGDIVFSVNENHWTEFKLSFPLIEKHQQE